jgi:hypothetical protein
MKRPGLLGGGEVARAVEVQVEQPHALEVLALASASTSAAGVAQPPCRNTFIPLRMCATTSSAEAAACFHSFALRCMDGESDVRAARVHSSQFGRGARASVTRQVERYFLTGGVDPEGLAAGAASSFGAGGMPRVRRRKNMRVWPPARVSVRSLPETMMS